MKKAFLVLSLLLTAPACALDYYFNNSEIDSDTGSCSQPVPCATLQHALHQLNGFCRRAGLLCQRQRE